jgi:hypothetical protein
MYIWDVFLDVVACGWLFINLLPLGFLHIVSFTLFCLKIMSTQPPYKLRPTNATINDN